MVVNYLQQFSKRDVIVHLFNERDVTDEDVEAWPEEEITDVLMDEYTYLGEENGIYYVILLR